MGHKPQTNNIEVSIRYISFIIFQSVNQQEPLVQTGKNHLVILLKAVTRLLKDYVFIALFIQQ
jgi:hypothetical protein